MNLRHSEYRCVATAILAIVISSLGGCSEPNCTVEKRTLTDEQQSERSKILTPFADEVSRTQTRLFDNWTGYEIPSLRGRDVKDMKRLFELASQVQSYRNEQRRIYFFWSVAAFGNIEAPELGAVIISVKDEKVEFAWSPPGPEF